MKKALVYNRKSRGDLEDLSKHEKELQDYCKRNNFESRYFEEIGSSKDDSRAEYVKLLDEIATNKYEVLVITDLSRLTRDLEHQLKLFKILTNHNMIIHSVMDGIIDPKDQTNKMLSTIKGLFNESAYEETSRKMALGRLQSVRAGKYIVAAPFGYKKNSEMKLEIDETEAPTVRRIFREILQGISITQISVGLYKDGFRTRWGNKHHPGSITDIIRRRVYIGETIYNSIEFDEEIRLKDTHEKIVSTEDFLKVQEIMANKKKFRTRTRKITSPLDKLLVCGLCNRRMQINISGKKKEYIHVQKCSAFNNEGKLCQNRGCSVVPLLSKVYKEVKKEVKVIEEKLELLYEGKNNDSLEKLKLELSNVEDKIKLKEKEKHRLLNFLLDGTIKELVYSDKNNQLEDEIKNLKIRSEDLTEIIVQNNIDNDIKYKEKLLADMINLESLHVDEQNRILSNIIEEIIYTRKEDKIKMKIYMN